MFSRFLVRKTHPQGCIAFHSLTGKYVVYTGASPSIEELTNQFLTEAHEETILDALKKQFEQQYKPDHLNRLNIVTNNQCNLTCAYCMKTNKAGTLKNSTESLLLIRLAEFFNIIQRNRTQEVNISFVGSEPLVIFREIRAIVEYIEKTYGSFIEKFNYSVNTNLTILNEEILQFFNRYNITIHTSLDGTKYYHDLIRRTRNGRGTFELVMRNIDLLRKYGYSVSGFHLTLTEENIDMDIDELTDFLVSNNFDDLIIEPNIFGLKLPADALAERLVNIYLHLYNNGIAVNGFWLRPYLRIVTSREYTSIFSETDNLVFCGAFSARSVSLSLEGDVMVCGYSHKLGDTLECRFNQAKSLAKSRVIGQIEFCKGCELEGLCRGGCYVSQINGKPSEYNCSLYKSVTEKLLAYSLIEE